MRGGGEWIHQQVLLKNGFLSNCLLFGNTKFVVTTNWLQVNAFTVLKPCGYIQVLLLYRNPKVVYFTTTLTAS